MGNRPEFTYTPLEGLVIVEPKIYSDDRGFFMESYSERDFFEAGITERFVQDNHSKSKQGVLRGLHFQKKYPQGKLVRVVAGSVLDVAVDLRCGSTSFGKWYSVVLSADNKRQLYVPPAFAHGFVSLEDDTQLLYKCTEYYRPEYDSGILWNDPDIGIDWQLGEYGIAHEDLILSAKDTALARLKDIDVDSLF